MKMTKRLKERKVSNLSRNMKKLIGIILCLAVVLTMVVPMNAFAEGEHEISVDCEDVNPGENKVTFRLSETVTTDAVISGTDVSVTGDKKIVVSPGNLNTLKIKFDNSFDKSNFEVIIYEEAEDPASAFSKVLPINGDNEAYFDGSFGIPASGVHIKVSPKGPQNEGGPESSFDGRAYFVWASGDKLCYHLFEGLLGRTDDVYPLNVIKVSEVTDQSGNNINYVFGQEMADWVLATDFEDEAGRVKFTEVAPVLGDGKDDHGITLNPCGAVNTNSSINTNGDMNFRASIIKDGYEAISFMADEEELEYFPGFLNGIFNNSTVDISGTTKNNPAVYTAYLLEKTVKFGLAEASKSPIKTVRALDVNPAAVTVEDKGDGDFEITFNSNFYDRVVFEITDEAGTTYYIRIARSLINAEDNFAPGVEDLKVTAQVYFPADMSKDDFEVVANIIFDDGVERTEIAKPAIIGFLNGNDIEDYEAEAGKNVKVAAYSVDVTKNVTNVYFTIVYKGALDGNTYGGTFGGSGKGFNFDLEERNIIFD